MIDVVRKELAKILRETADKLDVSNTELNDEQAIEIMSIVAHEPISKEEASNMLNVSRSTFNNMIDNGIAPKGRKRRGLKELIWYKDEIKNIKNR